MHATLLDCSKKRFDGVALDDKDPREVPRHSVFTSTATTSYDDHRGGAEVKRQGVKTKRT